MYLFITSQNTFAYVDYISGMNTNRTNLQLLNFEYKSVLVLIKLIPFSVLVYRLCIEPGSYYTVLWVLDRTEKPRKAEILKF